MANLRNNDALAYSDSLVELDPKLAVAHMGKLHYLFLNGIMKIINKINMRY